MTFHKIAVAGATGNLGKLILRNLLQSTDHDFKVVALARTANGSSNEETFSSVGITKQQYSHLDIVQVDYKDHEQLTQAIKEIDVVISALAGAVATQLDLELHKAIQAAGIRRFIPSQYTLDMLLPAAQEAFWPNAPPVASARLYKQFGEGNGPTSYTTVMTSMFVDTFIVNGQFGVYDIKNRKATLVDTGEAFFTGCTTEFIAAAIVAILKLPEEATKNKRIPVAEVRMSGNEIVETIEQVFKIDVERTYKSSEQLMEERNAALAQGNFRLAYANTVVKLATDGSGAGDLKDGLDFDAGGHLNFRRKTLKQMIEHAKEVLQ